MGYRMLPPTIANTADRDTRARLEQSPQRPDRGAAEAAPPRRGARDPARAPELGAPTYFHLYRDRFEYELEGLADQCRAFLDSTERLYEESMDRRVRERAGVGLAEAERYDIRRFLRGSSWDKAFPPTGCCRRSGHARDLGIDLDAQRNVHLDVEERPTKCPRAFCAPIEIPGKVMLVIQPQGGPDDWYALFHEAGHTEHFAFTDPSLKMEEKRLGDNAVTEGLGDALRPPDRRPRLARQHARLPAARSLRGRRRRAAALLRPPLLREAALRARAPRGRRPDADAQPLRRAARRRAQGRAEPDGLPRRHRLELYCTAYLRSWAFAAQMTSFMREQFGSDWFKRREAGYLLTELWELGQQPTADELLKDVTGAELDLEAVAEHVRTAIPTARLESAPPAAGGAPASTLRRRPTRGRGSPRPASRCRASARRP